ncbi:hypothetical protein [Shinella zoogloeoides]|uniref:hypothetical protein n=1 Tax=Shinella zoogloeoides TaxID=352475 RepID=UPI0028ACDECB|nr:hypothetical protein [Shinella zoogloeoides]
MKSVSNRLADDIIGRQARLSPTYFPLAAIKCDGSAVFRSQAARDYACLLDLDPDVHQWSCSDIVLRHGDDSHRTDLVVINTDGETCLVTVGKRSSSSPQWAAEAADVIGYDYRYEAVEDFAQGSRLRNAKDLLRYGCHRCPLGDRVRLLATLEDLGSLTIAECLATFQEGKAMPSLASLILNGFLEVDLDSGLIGPETQVRRIRDRV